MLVVIGLFVGLNLLFADEGPGRVIDQPASAPADPGVAEPANLESPCLVVVDFDGSFWVAVSGHPTLGPRDRPATVVLESRGRALLKTPARSIPLRRREGPLLVPPCPS